MPRYVNGVKIKRYSDAINLVLMRYPSYMKILDFILRPVPVIPYESIRRIIRPSRIPCSETPEDLYKDAVDLLTILSGRGLHPLISGSMIYCASNPKSDIDLVFYKHDRRDLEVLLDLEREKVISRLDDEDIKRIISEVGEKPDPATHTILLRRSIHEHRFRGRIVSLRFVSCDESIRRIICSRIHRTSFFSGSLEVSEDSHGYHTPSIYMARDLNSSEIIILYSHRIRYASLRTGDVIRCEGVLEYDERGLRRLNLDLSECYFERSS
ncbi:MAG: hypothetical protein QXJ51_04110 [Sulfolobales archaeon]